VLKFEFALLYFRAIGGSHLMKNKRLDIDALVEGAIFLDDHTQEGFIGVPHHKGSLHPSVFYAHLFLLKSNANGVSREDIINRLGITETFINEFLQGKVAVDLDFAKKLGDTTGIPHD
jgi:hypothetical protein|tara:strand:- start:409 stop:762 length:354 start_codon:yes stop_codon:yes gene_type:complete